MSNFWWKDEETGLVVVTHELFSQPHSLIGVTIPSFSEVTGEDIILEDVVKRYEQKLGYKLQKDKISLIDEEEAKKYFPKQHILAKGDENEENEVHTK